MQMIPYTLRAFYRGLACSPVHCLVLPVLTTLFSKIWKHKKNFSFSTIRRQLTYWIKYWIIIVQKLIIIMIEAEWKKITCASATNQLCYLPNSKYVSLHWAKLVWQLYNWTIGWQKSGTFSYYSNSIQVVYRGVAADAPRLKILILAECFVIYKIVLRYQSESDQVNW